MSQDATPTATPAVNAAEILGILPHRYPFLLVDRVLEVTPERIIAVKNVSWGEPYFQGHFPGNPVMPGVLMVEAMAQVAGILAAKSGSFDPATQVVYFMTIDKVKFRKLVTPGDQLIIEVVPLRTGRVWKLEGQIKVDGAVVCSAEFMATMAPRPDVTPAGS